MALALVTALVGCDEKKSAPETKATTTVAPTPTPTTAVAPTASGEQAKPSGEAAKPSGAAVTPSGTSASGTAAKPETVKAVPHPKGGAASKTVPVAGGMAHGNPEDGTLKYNPPPQPTKKDTKP